MSGTRDIYDWKAEDYDSGYRTNRHLAENLFTIRSIIGYRDKDRILDLGCGTGLLVEVSRIPACKYVGVDLSEKMLKVARKKFINHCFIRANIQPRKCCIASSVPFSKVVALFGSASYLNPKALLELKSRWPRSQCIFSFYSNDYRPNYHPRNLRLWSADEFLECAGRSGARKIRFSPLLPLFCDRLPKIFWSFLLRMPGSIFGTKYRYEIVIFDSAEN